jgi:hypothetical protein
LRLASPSSLEILNKRVCYHYDNRTAMPTNDPAKTQIVETIDSLRRQMKFLEQDKVKFASEIAACKKAIERLTELLVTMHG